MSEHKITIFKTISATSSPNFRDVTVALERIKEAPERAKKDMELINQIRLEKDKAKRNELKKGLTSYCFSGQFRQRSASGLIKHSGLICLDFDKFPDEETMNKHRLAFIKSPEKSKFTFALFTSPSGDGLKVIVKIPPAVNDHKAYFNALKEFYNSEYFDIACSDVSRVCYASYDPECYFNPESETWIEMEVNEQYEFASTVPVLKLKTEINIVQNLQKWFDKRFTMNTGEKNNNLFIFASAFNDFGVGKHTCEQYLLNKYGAKTGSGKSNEKEIINIVKSAYKKTGGTKFFEDKASIEFIERQIRSGIDKKRIYKKMADQSGYTEDDVDGAIKSISDSIPVAEFWYYDDKGKCRIKHYKFKAFLEQQGFYKLYPEGAENFIFVKIDNNMVEATTPDRIKDYVLNYLMNQASIDPYEVMASSTKLFKDDYLNLIDKADIAFFEDSIDMGVIYFNNGAAQIKTVTEERKETLESGIELIHQDKKTRIELIDYLNLNGYVWKKHIIDRNYEPVEFKDCVFDRFISKIAGDKPEKILAIKCTLGYLMHSFKTSANNKAVILNDETISDNPNGGSGKGLFCFALSQMKRVAILDGKTFDASKSFAYQTVGADTQILVYDDVPKNFAFENLFSVVTEGITLEKKNKDAIKLPVGKSPKIVINTNYTLGGVGGSFERRRWEIEFSSHFNSGHTPLMEFGHMLFDEWDELEWKKFDCMMIDCFRLYLENGLVKQEFTNLVDRKFIKETCFEFYEFIKENPPVVKEFIYKKDKYEQFLEEFPDLRTQKWFTQKKFTHWLQSYAQYMGYGYVASKNIEGRYVMYVPPTIHPADEEAEAIDKNTDPTQPIVFTETNSIVNEETEKEDEGDFPF